MNRDKRDRKKETEILHRSRSETAEDTYTARDGRDLLADAAISPGSPLLLPL